MNTLNALLTVTGLIAVVGACGAALTCGVILAMRWMAVLPINITIHKHFHDSEND